MCLAHDVCCACCVSRNWGEVGLGYVRHLTSARRQVGGSFGASAGLVLMELLPIEWNIQPGIYAIVGATATLGGVFRSSISLVCRPPTWVLGLRCCMSSVLGLCRFWASRTSRSAPPFSAFLCLRA